MQWRRWSRVLMALAVAAVLATAFTVLTRGGGGVLDRDRGRGAAQDGVDAAHTSPPQDDAGATQAELPDAPAADPERVGAFEVTRVVDGDTLVVRGRSGHLAGEEVRLRLAIVDTPEHGECGFDEATAFVTGWLEDRGRRFHLRRPTDAPQRDPFDRILGEVLAARPGDGAPDSLNVDLITAGLARIDGRFGAEDPDLLRRLRAARDTAPTPICPSLVSPTHRTARVPRDRPTPNPGTTRPTAARGRSATFAGWPISRG